MRIRIIDAFADAPFTGNPAGVCLLEGGDWPDPAWMQSVAAELNLSETAFAHPLPHDPLAAHPIPHDPLGADLEHGDPLGADLEHHDSAADWALRWFTPVTEVDLCGHATLATMHALRADGLAEGVVRFATRSGVLRAAGRADGAITLDFPAHPPVPAVLAPDLAAALGIEPVAVYTTGALGDLFVEARDEQTVRELRPDLHALSTVDARGVMVTARASAGSAAYHYVSRYFAPGAGIAEDPVTGSAYTALAPFWSARLGSPALTGLQVSARTGLVHTRVLGNRVGITGRAITILDGQLHV